MDVDSYAENFSKALFNYLWFSEGFISEPEITEIFTKIEETGIDVLEFVSEVAKAVYVLSIFSSSSFYKTMDDCFKQRGTTRLTAFTFLAKFSFEYHAVTEDIFEVVLNTCSYVFMLVTYCEAKDHPEFVQFGEMYWTEIFKRNLKDEFHAKGGWNELRTYVSENRYFLKSGDTDHDEVVPLLDELSDFFPRLNLKVPDRSCPNSLETIANLESSVVEGEDKPPTNCETTGISFGTVDFTASNVPGFNENSVACAEGVDKPQRDDGATESGRFASNIPGCNEKSDCCVEGVGKSTSEFSFGTVDLIASGIPGFNEKSKSVEFQFDNLNSKIVKLSEKYKLKYRGKQSLPAKSPVFDTAVMDKSPACLSMQNTDDHDSVERESKSEDIVFKSNTIETSTTIQEDSREEMVVANSYEGFDSDGEVAAPEAFRYIESSFFSGTYGRSPQEAMQTTDDQTTCKDLSRLQVASSDAIDPQCDYDKLYEKLKYIASFTLDTGTDQNGEDEPHDKSDEDSLV